MARIIFAVVIFFSWGAKASVVCPDNLSQAKRLILATSETMNSKIAEVRFYEKDSNQANWKNQGVAKESVIGKNGLGWAWTSKHYSAKADPVKKEGDGRTPAGFFKVGKPFGFGKQSRDSYVSLNPGENYCVDDVRSPHYNSVISKAKAGAGVSGEDMGTIPLYEQGLFLDYPTNRAVRGGSCIFIHVWRSKSSGTAGCVALSKANVLETQKWAAGADTVIAILPANALERMRACLPGV